MGRSVSTPSNTISQAIVDGSYMGYEWDEEEQRYNDEFDYDLFDMEWEDFIIDIVDRAKSKWKSFNDVSSQNKWAGREDRVLLENTFAQIGVSQYCGCINIWLRSRKDEYDSYYTDEARIINLCESWCIRIHENFMKEFAEYVKVGNMSNGEGVYAKA